MVTWPPFDLHCVMEAVLWAAPALHSPRCVCGNAWKWWFLKKEVGVKPCYPIYFFDLFMPKNSPWWVISAGFPHFKDFHALPALMKVDLKVYENSLRLNLSVFTSWPKYSCMRMLKATGLYQATDRRRQPLALNTQYAVDDVSHRYRLTTREISKCGLHLHWYAKRWS